MNRFLFLTLTGTAAYLIAFPPLDLGFFGPVALLFFGLAFRTREMRAARWLIVYAAGLAVFITGCFWISEVNFISLVLMGVFEGLALPLFCFAYRQMVFNRVRPLPDWIALPTAWIAVEYLRSVFPLDGFPWLLLGYTQWKYTTIVQVADLAGVYGPGFLLAMGAGTAVSWIIRRQKEQGLSGKKPVAGTMVFLGFLVFTVLYGLIRPHTLHIEKGPMLAAVQANIPQELKDNSMLASEVYSQYLDETRVLFERGSPFPSLVIWPETVFPYPVGDGNRGDIWWPESGFGYTRSLDIEQRLIAEKIVEKMLAPHGTWFLTGVVGYKLGRDSRLETRNGAFLYDPEGRRKNVYYKTILVPGGEYLPLINSLPFREAIESYVYDVSGGLPGLKPGFGERVMSLETAGGSYCFGVQICFENIYGDYCRRFVKKGADFLINISNEGWFKSSFEFDQMLAMSVFRAVETRRALFRSTNTGISCVIGPAGLPPGIEDRITKNGVDRAVNGVLKKNVPVCGSVSLYTLVGDLFAAIIFWGVFIFLAVLLFIRLWVTKVSFQE